MIIKENIAITKRMSRLMITSAQNGKVKRWKKLHRKRDREKEGLFMVEGHHLVEEAVKSDWNIKEIIVREDVNLPNEWQSYKWFSVNQEVFDAITETEQPQGVAAIVEMKEQSFQKHERVLVLDAIQDPGNLGTIIRTADAAGFDSIVVGKGTVDPFNDKVLRATQGSIFHIPVLPMDLNEYMPQLQDEGYSLYVTSLRNAKGYDEVTPKKPFALVVGNEGAGVQDSIVEMATEKVTIPIYGQAESLNVAIAAGILMYNFRN